MNLIPRQILTRKIEKALQNNPVVCILGPRQCGKSTIARVAADAYSGETEFFDLEDIRDESRLANPMLALQDLRGLVILDEIQRRPQLFKVLRVLADRPLVPAKFLILGSASPDIVKGVSETLAGRVAFIDMGGFNLSETGAEKAQGLWVRGGFPLSYLCRSDSQSIQWRENFIRTFLERDIPQLGISIPSAALRRFWTMNAHYHGNVFNAADFARSLGVAESTVRRYLDILSAAFVIRQLQPWHENIGKRQVKSPKVYIRDTGLLHALLGIGSYSDVLKSPKAGASWEGFVVEQVLSMAGSMQAYFWSTHAGAELDLLLMARGERIGVEIKLNDAPRTTKSMHMALQDLHLKHLYVAYPGDKSYPLQEKISALAINDLADFMSGLTAA